MKFAQTDYLNSIKSIIKFPDHYVGVPVTIDSTGLTANADGKKIVPAGTIIGTAGANPILSDTAMKGKAANDATSEGILLEDVDCTYGDAPGTLLIHGFVDLNKIPAAPATAAATALAGRIVFLK